MHVVLTAQVSSSSVLDVQSYYVFHAMNVLIRLQPLILTWTGQGQMICFVMSHGQQQPNSKYVC